MCQANHSCPWYNYYVSIKTRFCLSAFSSFSILLFVVLFSDVGGDVMVFFADRASDIVKIIDHRRQLVVGTAGSTSTGMHYAGASMFGIIFCNQILSVQTLDVI